MAEVFDWMDSTLKEMDDIFIGQAISLSSEPSQWVYDLVTSDRKHLEIERLTITAKTFRVAVPIKSSRDLALVAGRTRVRFYESSAKKAEGHHYMDVVYDLKSLSNVQIELGAANLLWSGATPGCIVFVFEHELVGIEPK